MMIVSQKTTILIIIECILIRESLSYNGTVQTGASLYWKVTLVLLLKLDDILMNPLILPLSWKPPLSIAVDSKHSLACLRSADLSMRDHTQILEHMFFN